MIEDFGPLVSPWVGLAGVLFLCAAVFIVQENHRKLIKKFAFLEKRIEELERHLCNRE